MKKLNKIFALSIMGALTIGTVTFAAEKIVPLEKASATPITIVLDKNNRPSNDKILEGNYEKVKYPLVEPPIDVWATQNQADISEDVINASDSWIYHFDYTNILPFVNEPIYMRDHFLDNFVNDENCHAILGEGGNIYSDYENPIKGIQKMTIKAKGMFSLYGSTFTTEDEEVYTFSHYYDFSDDFDTCVIDFTSGLIPFVVFEIDNCGDYLYIEKITIECDCSEDNMYEPNDDYLSHFGVDSSATDDTWSAKYVQEDNYNSFYAEYSLEEEVETSISLFDFEYTTLDPLYKRKYVSVDIFLSTLVEYLSIEINDSNADFVVYNLVDLKVNSWNRNILIPICNLVDISYINCDCGTTENAATIRFQNLKCVDYENAKANKSKRIGSEGTNVSLDDSIKMDYSGITDNGSNFGQMSNESEIKVYSVDSQNITSIRLNAVGAYEIYAYKDNKVIMIEKNHLPYKVYDYSQEKMIDTTIREIYFDVPCDSYIIKTSGTLTVESINTEHFDFDYSNIEMDLDNSGVYNLLTLNDVTDYTHVSYVNTGFTHLIGSSEHGIHLYFEYFGISDLNPYYVHIVELGLYKAIDCTDSSFEMTAKMVGSCDIAYLLGEDGSYQANYDDSEGKGENNGYLCPYCRGEVIEYPYSTISFESSDTSAETLKFVHAQKEDYGEDPNASNYWFLTDFEINGSNEPEPVVEPDGSKENPYTISTSTEWNQMVEDYKNHKVRSTSYFELTKDISGVEKGFSNFYGTFEGNGHTITVDMEGHFFGELLDNCTIKNLTIDGDIELAYEDGAISQYTKGAHLENVTMSANIICDHDCGGFFYFGLDSSSDNKTQFKNCCFDGTLTVKTAQASGASIGGFCCAVSSSIFEDCTVSSNAIIDGKGSDFVGGFATISDFTTSSMTRCKNNGTIIGGNYVAGLVCDARMNNIDCENNGTVTGEGNVGGLASIYSEGKTTGFTNTGTVTAKHGLVGGVAAILEDCELENCSNEGTVYSGIYDKSATAVSGLLTNKNHYYAGGIAGYTIVSEAEKSVTIKNCSNTGSIYKLDGDLQPTTTTTTDNIGSDTQNYFGLLIGYDKCGAYVVE